VQADEILPKINAFIQYYVRKQKLGLALPHAWWPSWLWQSRTNSINF